MTRFKTLQIVLFGITCLLLSGSLSAQTQARFYTNKGNFDVKLREDLAPITAGNFIDLVDTMFYDGVIFHRVVNNFVIQGGDPTGTGSGGPGYTIPDEFHPALRHYKRGIMSMANAGPNTGGSQFFFCMKPLLYLDSLHAVFGEVIDGMETIDSIEVVPVDATDRPITPVVMDSVRILAPVNTDRSQNRADAVLGGNFPNPFNESTSIAIGLYEPANPRIRILDQLGREVRVISPGTLSSGDHLIKWDGRNKSGGLVPSGTYYYQLLLNDFVDTKIMTITR